MKNKKIKIKRARAMKTENIFFLFIVLFWHLAFARLYCCCVGTVCFLSGVIYIYIHTWINRSIYVYILYICIVILGPETYRRTPNDATYPGWYKIQDAVCNRQLPPQPLSEFTFCTTPTWDGEAVIGEWNPVKNGIPLSCLKPTWLHYKDPS